MSILALCKFTPLGFETTARGDVNELGRSGVNLPRWGLKQATKMIDERTLPCKFTPLGFETRLVVMFLFGYIECKFTPLGFETQV